MRYEMMFPSQIRQAIDENWPVVLAVGVLEYHSEHCAVGVDTLVVIKTIELLEKEMDLVVLPAFHYGSASYAVEPPERKGSIHIDSGVLNGFACELFRGLLRVGFRNIHVFLHHQSENFEAGKPTDLALKLAARQIIFDFLEKEYGEGWWGDEKMQNYYSDQKTGKDPFGWIQIHPFMDKQSQEKFPPDHAGLQETSLMKALCPQGVDMSKLDGQKWYALNAKESSEEYGEAAVKMIIDGMRCVLAKSSI